LVLSGAGAIQEAGSKKRLCSSAQALFTSEKYKFLIQIKKLPTIWQASGLNKVGGFTTIRGICATGTNSSAVWCEFRFSFPRSNLGFPSKEGNLKLPMLRR